MHSKQETTDREKTVISTPSRPRAGAIKETAMYSGLIEFIIIALGYVLSFISAGAPRIFGVITALFGF